MASTVTLDELSYCFDASLECLGEAVKDVIYHSLERLGIDVRDIPLRIPEVAAVLRDMLGSTSTPIIRRMFSEFHRERSKARMRLQNQ